MTELVGRPWMMAGVGLLVASIAVLAFWAAHSRHAKNGYAPVQDRGSLAATASAEAIVPLPQRHAIDERKVSLGERLFHDPRLSRNNSLSCATCHDVNKGGADGLPHSVGIAGTALAVNTPTVFNTGFNFRQFWDGRAASLEEQVDGPLQHPEEMGSTWSAVIAKLTEDKVYRDTFREIYPDAVTVKNVRDAIASFERSLVTPDSRFDRFLRGERAAISAAELNGYRLFTNYGCIACHQGVNMGGNMFQKFGVMRDYFRDRGNVTEADLGRYNVTKMKDDRHVFKVPGLRNVALTGPYFHDGSAASLQAAVAVMGKYQLGVEMPEGDIALIAAFLETLTGHYSEWPE